MAAPDPALGERTLLVCLPSTWTLLRRLADRLSQAGPVVAVHSTAPVPPAAYEVVDVLRDTEFRAVELLGSTETGAVARRALVPGPEEALWTLFDDVTPVWPNGVGGEQPLRVAGPRIARAAGADRAPASVTLDDLVEPVDERRFRLLGRSTRLIKINGRRVHLEDVETTLQRAFPGAEMVCVAHRDAVRSEHYDLYYSGRATDAEVRSVLSTAFPDTPLPRRVGRVERIPRSATGKVRLDRLLAEFREEAVTRAR